MNRVYEFLKDCGMYYVASVDEGHARVRPFGTIDLFDGGLYIQTGRVKPVYRQISANPGIEISAMKAGKVLRLSADAVEDKRVEAEAHMLEAYPGLQNSYAAGDGNTVVFRLTNVRAVFSSMGKEEEPICF